jgi:hypothetical protein
MLKLMHPSLEFRILYRQFLLRIVDLESLSSKADIEGFVGQFGGVLIMLSLIHAFIAVIYLLSSFAPADRLAFAWHAEQYLVATMMLVVGLFAVLTWDATFPDRRDVMVLAPLPIATHTILFAKVAASGTILGIAILALNVASGIVWPLALGIGHGSITGLLQCFAAYWFTMIAAGIFLFCTVLTVQGMTALLLPRKVFLRLSAFLQLGAFALLVSVYFLQPTLTTPQAFIASENQRLMTCSPSLWFFALFNQLNGSLDPAFTPLVHRAWIGLSITIVSAASSLLLCYLHTMRKTAEQPDLIAAASKFNWNPRFGTALETAIVLFSIRSLTRSRQHRISLAFYLGVGFAVALVCINFQPGPVGRFHPIVSSASTRFHMATLVMLSFAVVGLRSAFSLPVSLNANWVMRITELWPSQNYTSATRRSILLLAVVPVCVSSALCLLRYEPPLQAAAHLLVLALLGSILADLNLLSFHKIPFSCSYLPGKSNIQFAFWAYLLVFVPVTIQGAQYEDRALHHPILYLCLISGLAITSWGLWALNSHLSKSATLHFEEFLPDEITTLGLSGTHM